MIAPFEMILWFYCIMYTYLHKVIIERVVVDRWKQGRVNRKHLSLRNQLMRSGRIDYFIIVKAHAVFYVTEVGLKRQWTVLVITQKYC